MLLMIKNKVYSMNDNIQLIKGDCLVEMQKIPDKSIDRSMRERFLMPDITSKTEKEYLSDYYKISRDGSVERKEDGKSFTLVKDKKGYYMVRLKSPAFSKNKDKRKNYKVHRLVAMFYLNNYSDELQVNHKNGIKTDNRVDNLEMVTNQQNSLHAWRVLDSTKRREMLSKRNALDKERIQKMIKSSVNANSKRVIKKNMSGDIVAHYESETAAAKAEGISLSLVSYLIRNQKNRNNYYYYYE